MSNPVGIDCPKDVWTLVASGVLTGKLENDDSDADYFATYRVAGDPAPTTLDNATRIFSDTKDAGISSTEAIDVYIQCQTKDGRVVVSV